MSAKETRVFIITLMLIIVIGAIASTIQQVAIWNDGVHADCGGEWQFIGTRSIGKSTYIIYECSNCHYMWESTGIFNKEVR